MKHIIIMSILASILGLFNSCFGTRFHGERPWGIITNGNNKKAKMPEGKLLMVECSKHGTMIQPIFACKVELEEDNTATCAIWQGDAFRKFRIDPSILDEMRDVIKSHEMYKYYNSYSDPNILDGTMWSFSAHFYKDRSNDSNRAILGDKETMYSSGSNAGPSDNGIYELIKIAEKAVEGAEFLNFTNHEWERVEEPTIR